MITYPFRYCLEAVNSIGCLAVSRPLFTFFICSILALTILAMYNRKFQDMMFTIPYDKIFFSVTSKRMITFYVSLFEVVVELLMTIIFAGVSIVITMWLLFEENQERRQKINLSKFMRFI